ncbi:MAG: CDP-diacylglycerol--glycerol-3-phosphate 3-phosphatidyltransferase [Chloroflexales bacterium]|nr:CDP-diacylglycerol--glycerol-3-phosphate 3-phosphatidyltransferase [Chloroflexales bacterium]
MWRQIPNLLGVFRIVATPLLMWLVWVNLPWGYVSAIVLLIAMAVSDFLDGNLARRWQVVSPLGVFLDTISDKIFVMGALLPLIELGKLSSWIALVIVVREFAVSGLRSYAAAEGRVIAAGIWGKQKLAITVVALVWRLLAAYAESGGAGVDVGVGAITLRLIFGLWWLPMTLAVIWTIFSAVDYFWNAWPLLRASWRPDPVAPPSVETAQRVAKKG